LNAKFIARAKALSPLLQTIAAWATMVAKATAPDAVELRLIVIAENARLQLDWERNRSRSARDGPKRKRALTGSSGCRA
jgi:hypothetical protein